MTRDNLRLHTRKELAAMAKRRHVAGWHAMRKDELIEALVAAARSGPRARSRSRNGNGKSAHPQRRGSSASNGSGSAAAGSASMNGNSGLRTRNGLAMSARNGTSAPGERDQVFVQVVDARWLHVGWSVNQRTIERAEAALGIEWHQAVPVIRVFDVTADDAATASETLISEDEIHDDADDWYVRLDNSLRSLRLHIGYRTPSGRFFALARSRKITTPCRGARRSGDLCWNNGSRGKRVSLPADAATVSVPVARHFAQRVRQRLPALARATTNAPKNGTNGDSGGEFALAVEAELIVHGRTHPHAELTLLGEPVPLAKDGSFALQITLTNGRQIIPAVAVAPNGGEQRTVVLAVERNTKELEPRRVDELLL